jgi:hypothetical protein
VAILIPVLELVEQTISHCCLLIGCPPHHCALDAPFSLDGLGTIVPSLNHTAHSDRSMDKQIRHVNRVMHYFASNKIMHTYLFNNEFKGFQFNFRKCLTKDSLTFVKNMNYIACTVAESQRG